MLLDEDSLDGTAADRFDADSARPGENIEKARACERRRQNIKQRLAQAIGRWTQRIPFERFEQTRAIFPGDYPHVLIRFSRGGSGVATRRGVAGGRVEGRAIAARLRQGRRLLFVPIPRVLCRGGGWRCGSRGRRIGGYRRIRRGRGG